MKLHYATLRLGIAATEAQIKVAYRARARELHPDAAPEVDPRAFVELSEAQRAGAATHSYGAAATSRGRWSDGTLIA